MRSPLSTSPTHARLREACQRHLPPMFERLREWVGDNSFTLNRAGVDVQAKRIGQAFESMGFKAERVPSSNPDFADHLVLARRGTGSRTMALISHLDTVYPPEEEAAYDFRWRLEDDRVYGPGTVDVKGGTALAWLMMAALRDATPEQFNAVHWIFLLNSSEEMPSADFGALCRDRIPADAIGALVMEGGARAGSSHALVTARKGRALFRVEALGRGAHAGNLHERGINAISQLAHTVRRIEGLTNHERGLTFNTGVISGGTVVNRVPHQAVAEVEMRAFDPGVYRAGLDAIHALESGIVVRSAEDDAPCRLIIEKISEIPPWPRNDATERLFRVWRDAGRELGMTIVRQERGGISDGNHICHHVPTLDGLGPCGDHAHCSERSPDGSKDQEYAERDSFLPRAMLNCAALLRVLD